MDCADIEGEIKMEWKQRITEMSEKQTRLLADQKLCLNMRDEKKNEYEETKKFLQSTKQQQVSHSPYKPFTL